MTDTDILAHLLEARFEITRLNKAAGRTVFNPAAKDGIDTLIIHFTKAPAR